VVLREGWQGPAGLVREEGKGAVAVVVGVWQLCSALYELHLIVSHGGRAVPGHATQRQVRDQSGQTWKRKSSRIKGKRSRARGGDVFRFV
jgi:hypothetical protein